ncbi:MAG: glutamine synthetase III [Bacteroidales bacterium]|nr:glutamine synthetase III [Bacteroidales bacterium]
MDNLRFKALSLTLTRKRRDLSHIPKKNVSEYYGELTFSDEVMQRYLTKTAYKRLRNAIDHGHQIDRAYADEVAIGMQAWAISLGATHYTHWFHPLTGATAEKHDAFININENGKAIENFGGTELVQQEPDASSFPSGGIRSTFEARGYTAWDPSSPAFIIEDTLCIPTIFVSYTGEALDYKTPLLKALSVIDKAATDVCKYFNPEVQKIHATLGWEQEYFLIDSALHHARPDIMLTGRSLFGHASAKDQQLDDHYFGAINTRVMDFMREFEYEAHRLGIPVKTRHNEVAPNQFECAPIFEEANIAVDHNQLVMHVIERVARRHEFVALFHEKPFAKVNGSGKHNNWSLATDTGVNLLSPGKTRESNMRFITFLVNIVKAVNKHSDLMRAHIATIGNDHRLGANEAPPAIMSVFIGSTLTQMLDDIESGKISYQDHVIADGAKINIPKIPEIMLDNTDRNRTSPFAFTGNKFEFRAVGSSDSCAKPMVALNTIVGDQLIEFKKEVDQLIAEGKDTEEAIFTIVKHYIADSKRIRFEGNSYGQEWKDEAKERGLSNITSSAKALKSYVSDQTISLFVNNDVLSKRELEARYEIKMENYFMKLQIESRVMGDLAQNHIIPVAIKYQNTLLENVRGLREVLDSKTFNSLARSQVNTIKEISEHIQEIKEMVLEMIEARKSANQADNMEEKALLYFKTVYPFMVDIRYHVDKLELLVDDDLWPLPKYREMLFIK